MNCATHSDTAAVAFCRTCRKPLCNQCTRDVRGVIYCEACLAARMEGQPAASSYVPPYVPPVPFVPQGASSQNVPPQTPYQQFMDQGLGMKVGPGPASGPNPAVAGMLAGIFPFGVGAVYTNQYAKGLAHLVIMVLLIVAESSDVPWYAHMVLGIMIGFFYIYQIIDSVRSAKAIQMGEPAPDPFGLAQSFGAGERFEGAKVPTGAAVLIGLGLLFLLHTAGLFEFGLDRFWPLILIFLGGWIFARNWGLMGNSIACQCERCRTRKLMGPAMLVTIGIIFLLENNSRIGIDKTWPAILLVIGVVQLVRSNASSEGHTGPLRRDRSSMGMPSAGFPPAAPGAEPIVTPPPQNQNPQDPELPPSSGEVKNV